jgi:hypothetical protein
MRTNTNKGVTVAVLALVLVSLVTPRAQAIPPDPDNAALLYYQGFLALAELDDEAHDLMGDVAKGKVDPNDKVREYIGQCHGGIEFAEAAADVPNCHWGFRFSQGFDALMPQLSQARFLTYVLVADARVRAVDGDYRGALERCLMTETFSRHIGDDTLISYLVSIAVKAVGYRCMDDVVGQAADDAALLEWLKRELATGSGYEVSPMRPLKFEREIVMDTLRMDKIDQLATLLAEADEKVQAEIRARANEEELKLGRQVYSERVTSALEILVADGPYEETFTQLERLSEDLDPNAPGEWAAGALMPAIGRIYNLKTRSVSDARAIRIGVEICLQRAKTGRLPKALPVGSPKDPFSGKDFAYERTDDGFVLRCRQSEMKTERLHEYVFAVK